MTALATDSSRTVRVAVVAPSVVVVMLAPELYTASRDAAAVHLEAEVHHGAHIDEIPAPPELCTASRDAATVHLEAEIQHGAHIDAIPAPYEDRYELIQPIPVDFEEVGPNAVIAHFREAAMAMTGYDRQDARDALAPWILDMFGDLSAADPATLGRRPTTQLRVLRDYLRRS